MQALKARVFILRAEMASESWDAAGQMATTTPEAGTHAELARAGQSGGSAGPSSVTNLSQVSIN